MGCVKKGELKGWFLTEQGRQIGGVQVEAKKLGVLFVRWHESIVEVCALVETISQVKGTASKERNTISGSKEDKGFREKFEAKLRTTDVILFVQKQRCLLIIGSTWQRSFMPTKENFL